MKSSVVYRIVGVALLLLAVTCAFIFLPIRDTFTSFLEWVRELGPWGPIALGLASIVACTIALPGLILTLGAGFLFGVVLGAITAWTAATIGASLAFLLGRTLARGWVEQMMAARPKFRALDEAVKQNGFKIVLLMRLSPAFPFNVLNYALGLTKVSFRDYVLATWIGMLPGAFLYAYIGSTLRELSDLAAGNYEGGVPQIILFVVGLLATIVVTVLITRMARRALKKETNNPERGALAP